MGTENYVRTNLVHRDKVEIRIDELLQMLERLKMPIKRPKVIYKVKGTVAGYALRDHSIDLNESLLIENLEYFLLNTVAHEVAHLVVFVYYPKAKTHGWEWSMIMRKFGLAPNRQHKYKVTPARKFSRYNLYCECRIHSVTAVIYNRVVMDKKIYRCKSCRGRVSSKDHAGVSHDLKKI